MNLETLIDKRLWLAIKSNYESRQYTNAILDSIYFISEFIRERSGIESDGVALIGQALGGKNPILKTTNLETESDINIQKGIEQILRGIYQGIRNPRSHEKYSDTKEEADAIIYFISYLLNILDKSKTPFTKDVFLERIFDENFVENERYSDLLIEEIPKKLYLEIAIEVFRRKTAAEGKKLEFFYKSIFKKLSKKETVQFCELVSEELKNSVDTDNVKSIIYLFPKDKWKKLDEIAKLRVENILIKDIKKGQYKITLNKVTTGAFGTWIKSIIDNLTLRDELNRALVDRFLSGGPFGENYVMKIFFNEFVKITNYKFDNIESVFKKGLQEGDVRYYDFLTRAIEEGPSIWKERFSEDYDNFEEKILPADVEEEELPF